MKTKIFAVVLLLFVCLLFNNAFADPPVNTISVNTDTLDTHFIDYLKNKILQLGDTIADKALTLLLSLAIINIFIVGMKLLFKGANYYGFWFFHFCDRSRAENLHRCLSKFYRNC